jgi:molybdate transport system substrate-binding protein
MREASMSTIRTLALQSPQIIIGALAAAFERRSGHKIEQLLRPDEMPVHARQKLDAGAQFDAAFVLPALMDQLVAEGRVVVGSRTGFLRVPIGVAVRAGAPKPAIGTVDAFRQAMLDAKSVAFLKAGISGPHLDALFARFGIAKEIQAKSRRTETDTVGELVAAGEAEVGVTAIATLMATPGLDIVGPIPAEIQAYVVFEAAVSATTAIPEAAKELIAFVTGPEALPVIRSKGMQPW